MTDSVRDAIEVGDANRLNEILSSGEDPNQIMNEPFKMRPIHASIISIANGGSRDMMDIVIKYGADLNMTYPGVGGATPLILAIFNDLPDIAKELISKGADPNMRGEEGDSPLRASVEMADHDLTRFLIDNGAARTINEFGGFEGCTALGLACRRLDMEMVQILMGAGADATALDLDYQSAEDRIPAAEGTDVRLVNDIRILLKSKIEVELRSKEGL